MDFHPPDWRLLRILIAILLVLGGATAYLTARYPDHALVIGDSVLGFGSALLVIWYWLRRLPRSSRSQPIRWLLVMWAMILLLDLAASGGGLGRWRATAPFLLFIGVLAGSYWLAIRRFGYRRASFSPRRAAVIGALGLCSVLLLYGMWRWREPWGNLSGLAGVFVAVALLRALLNGPAREGPSGGTRREPSSGP